MKRMFGTGRYANVTSTLALIVALSGTAYAANTIRSSDIVNGQVRSVDLANNAVTSGKVRNGSLRSRDFRAGELPAGPRGATGAPGPAGPQGRQGDPGAPATRLFANVASTGTLGAANQGATAATRTGNGQYTVTFNRPLGGCVALAQGGFAEGTGGAIPTGAFVTTTVSGSTVGVSVRTAAGVGDDSNFNVAVFC